MKICRKCKEEKDSSCFGEEHRNRDGLRSYCNECNNKYRKTEKGLEVNRRAVKKYHKTKKGKEAQLRSNRRRDPRKTYAVRCVGIALKYGKLTKQPCEVCGELKVEAHHTDYEKPLDVVWYCKEHHTEIHRKVLV
jgi:hypothetical protein